MTPVPSNYSNSDMAVAPGEDRPLAEVRSTECEVQKTRKPVCTRPREALCC
jgi:hypothetical protein